MSYIEHNNRIKQKDSDGFFKLEEDKKAIIKYQEYINENSLYFDNYIDKLEYLINNGYYINILELYNYEDILMIYNLLKDYQFEFKSFMAISKFYDNYALKSYDKKYYLETIEERILICSLYLAKGDIKFAKDLALTMIKQEYQPATPTFLNSGKKQSGELISCFLLEIDDSLNSINYNLSTAMQLSKIGGGVAINLSNLRARGEDIKGYKNVSRGVLPVMKLFEDAFNYVDQLGQRPGAGVVYLNIFHQDVLEFLDTKKINADEKNRIQSLSIGLNIPDKFMELAKNNEDVYLFAPNNIYQEYGLKFNEIDFNKMYVELVKNENINKTKIKARDLLQQIAITQFESGYPYLVFVDNANNQNPLKNIGKISMSNLCTEIFQIQKPSIINDYGIKDEIGYDVCCNLGSLNIVNVMEEKDFEKTIDVAIKALNSVSDMSNIKNAPGINKANQDFHAIGLGVMNLHGFFAKEQISYESEEAKEFCEIFFSTLNYYTIKASMKIAKEKKETFVGFEKSEYYNGNYFQTYIVEELNCKSEKIKKLFENINIPTTKDWINLKNDVKTYGMYNAYRLAIAPTQSISYVQNATASIQPVVDLIETRMYRDSLTYYPMPYLSKDNIFYYKSAYNMNQEKIIDLISVIQKHIDQGISTVLYVTSDATTKDLVRLYYYAWKKGLKSLYYVRTKNLTIEECSSCSV